MMGSGGGRPPITCKFGVQCHRLDCWYSHPDGRMMDAGGGVGGALLTSGAMGTRGGGGLAPRGGGAAPMRSAGIGASPRMGGSSSRNECRYSFDCTRRDCHFNHPHGRAIDGDGGGGAAGGGVVPGMPTLNRPPSNSSMGSLSRGMSEVSFGSYPPANATDDEQDLKDTWFPKAMDCTCCKGYVYGCTSAICEDMGQCTCSIEEKDLEGGGDSMSSSGGMGDLPSSPHASMNGSPAPGVGKLPPQPPTEGALARAAVQGTGAAGREAARSSGGATDCRYGLECTRADCSFRHPQGRNMDMDGVSFGDFGARGVNGGRDSGGGRSSGAGKPVVDQDLMDTWYPDCRECVCCKGYKHGCKTAACAEAGLCACSSSGGAASPIVAVSTPPPVAAADATKEAATSCGEGESGGRAVVSSADSVPEATTTSETT